MDEDLKIIVTSELEADEQASAQRISAQLPDIAKLINQKSKIKVQVEVDNSNVQTEAQKFSKELSKAAQTHKVGVSVGLDRDSVKKMQAELNSLKVNPDVSHAMTAQLEKMGIQIDRISGRWEQANDQEERMLSLSIQGTDQLGRSVSYLQTYDAVTGDINTHLTNVTMNLEKQRQVEAQIAAKAKADNESRISYLTKQKAVLSDIQATYTGATSVKPVQETSHLNELNAKYSELEAKIQSMINTSGQLDKVQRANIEAEIASLKQLVKEYQNAEYVATKLRTKGKDAVKADQFAELEGLEKRLQSAGIYTDEFKKRIGELRNQLSNAFDQTSLTAFLNSFDKLEGDIKIFQEQLRGVNAIYTQLIGVENKMTRTKSAMVGLDPTADKEKLAALNEQLALYRSQKQALESQLAPYSAIIQYARQAEAVERARLENEVKLKFSEAELADKAREIEQTMQRIPSTVKDLEVRFGQLVAPTDNLVQKMQMLRETEAAYHSAKTDTEKIAAYERLQFLIGECSKEISELNRVQRGDVLDFRFSDNLEKAKADLATIGRQWSALKHDPGLNAQFQQLEYGLKRVNNQMDLNKWTAQFSRFKSEVKAAGKNMQSLGDVLKNNVGKVLQWVSATTLLFRAFALTKKAISTIIALDTAMIDLRKTTEATEEEYRKFFHTANDTAKALGVTTEEVISQTAEWSRLGYTMEEAAKLAENSAIFRAVSPEMDIAMATDGLVSIIKAFDIDVEDSMDGIISKVNAVGNAFAVSNADVVEALTRSSAAMSVANNTFDETVALATAAIEITRDASSVGNALKTISMRIRGYDEETEEYVGGVEELTGAIADLTKTASNNRGISLFENGDPETYRSTYDILADIAGIWDELTDKNRADLLEKLFGKQRAQVGAALLSNFEQAEKSIETMANSAGSARDEMENIYESLDYKLNALQETWVGVAQNLFDTDQMKLIVEVLIFFSEIVDGLTESLGLFGTAGLAVVIGHLFKFRSTLKTIETAVAPVLNTLSTMSFDGSAASVLSYASALSSLDPVQQRLAMSMAGLNSEQQERILTMSAATMAMSQYTVAELEKNLGMQAGTIANGLNVESTKRVTVEILKAAVANGTLTEAQMKQILTTNKQNAANGAAAVSFKNLGQTAGAAWKSMSALSKFSLIAGVVTTAITLIASAWNYFSERAERAKQKMQELEDEFKEIQSTITSTANSFTNLKNTSDDVIPRFAELAKGVNEFGENISLTDKEYEEFLSLNNQIAEMFPELDLGFDSNGNHILALSLSVDTLTESLNALVEAERQTANAEIAANLGNALENLKGSDKAYDKELKALQDRKDAYNEAFSEINRMYAEQDRYREAYGDRWQDMYDLDTSNYVTQMQQAFGTLGNPVDAEAWQQMIAPFTDADDIGKIDWHGVINSDEFSSAMAVLDRQIEAQEKKKESRWQKLNPIMGAWLQTTDEYSTSTENVQDVLSKVIGNIDYSKIGITKEAKLQSYVTENFIKPIYDAKPEAQNALVALYDIKSAFDAGALTVGEYGITDYILGDLEKEGLNDEILSNVRISLNLDEFESQVSFVKDGLRDVRSEYSDTIDYYNKIRTEIKAKDIDTSNAVFGNIDTNARQVLEWTEENIEKYRFALESWEQNTDDLLGQSSTVMGGSGSFDGVEIAYSPMLQTEDGAVLLDSNTLTNYISSILDKAREDGEWTDEELLALDAEGLEVDGQRIKGLIADIGESAALTGEVMHYVGEDGALNGTYKELKLIADELGVTVDDLLIQYGSIDEYINSLSASELKLAYEIIEKEGSMTVYELHEKLRELRYEAAKMVTPLDFSTMASSLEETAKGIDKVVSAMEKLAEGTALSKSELMDLIDQYPELLEQANLFADGSVEAQRNALNSILGLKEAEYDAQIDAKIAELKATQQVLEDQLALEEQKANLINEIKNLEVNGKIEQEEDFVNKLSEYNDLQGRNYVSLVNGEVQVNEEALNDKLAQEHDYGESATENIWEPLGETIVASHEQGYTGALTATNNYTTSLWTRIKNFFSNIGSAIATAWSDMWAGTWQGIGTYFSQAVGTGLGSVSGGTVSVNFGGTETTVGGQNVSDWISEQEEAAEKRIAQIEEIQTKTLNAINNLESLKGLNLTDLYASSKSDDKDGSGSDKVEEYIVDIEKYREALERLRKAQEQVSDIELQIEESDNLKEKILLTRQLIGAYEREQEALEDLNRERSAIISAGAQSLRELGFAVEYNADTNDLWISNMEHLNGLTADSKGKYDSLQEATNALREDTEDLIESITDLNEENRDGTSTWKEVESGISDAREQIMEYLNEIVQQASDAVDTIQNVYDTLHDAADEYASSGFITVDTLQSIIALGQQYVAYLIDENGQLVINEERIQAVIAARTQQLAIESSLAYVEALRMAKAEGDIATLNNLLYATEQATNATWGFVYANLALAGLDENQYQAALQNINAIRAMADSAVQSIGKTVGGVTEELEEMQDGLNDILDYVMDMLKQRIQEQIDGLEDMKDAYSEIIDLKKESLQASKDEADHQKTMASKMREIAKLQARIDALSLDDSRDAQAEKAALLEEMSELQGDLADEQANRTLEAQEDALDKMEEAYHEEKDREIEKLEESISSTQKLYDMAIDYIESNWGTLREQLIAWNYEVGSSLESELVTAWDNAYAAAQRYGGYVSALNSIGGDIEASQSVGTNLQVGNTNYDSASSNEDMIHAIIKEMYQNSQLHHSADTAGKAYLNQRNKYLGETELAKYGVIAKRGDDGVWYVGHVGGELLYEKYKRYIYHKGGIVGGGDIKSNEQISLLKTKEWVLSEQMVDNLTTQMDRINQLSDAMDDLPNYAGNATLADVMKQVGGSKTVNNVTNNSRPIELQIGDTIIHGADQSTVEKHIKVTRDMVNQIGRIIGIGR